MATTNPGLRSRKNCHEYLEGNNSSLIQVICFRKDLSPGLREQRHRCSRKRNNTAARQKLNIYVTEIIWPMVNPAGKALSRLPVTVGTFEAGLWLGCGITADAGKTRTRKAMVMPDLFWWQPLARIWRSRTKLQSVESKN